VLDGLAGPEDAGVEAEILVHRDRTVPTLAGGEEPQSALLVLLGEELLLVAGGQTGALRQDPDLEKMDVFLAGSVVLAVGHPGTGGHPLHIARLDHRAVAHAIAVLQAAGKHVRDDLHVAVRVGTEAPAGLHPVLVDDPQLPEPHEPGVVVARERERVVRVEPPVVRMTSLAGAS